MTNWIVCKLDEICDIFTGNSINEKEKFEKYTNISTGYNYIGTKDIGFDQWIDYDNGIKIPANDLKFKIAPKGSVLLCIEGGSAGRKIGLTRQNVCFGNKLCAFVSKIDNKYIFYFLQTSDFRNIFSYNKNGLIGGVSVNKLKNIEIPLPPLAEQGRIVAKIEELFAGIDAGVENLKSVKNQIALYRQAVLKSAFEGNLTNEWREENLPTKIKNDLTVENTPFSIPSNWTWFKLPQIGTVERGKSKHRPRNDKRLFGGKYPFIQTGEIKASKQYLYDYSETYSDFGLSQSRLWDENTLCITIAANIAETAILKIKACFPDSVVGFTKNDLISRIEYVEYYMRLIRENLDKAAPATAQKNINLQTLSEVLVPVPSLTEQERIVAEIESRFERADALETAVDRALNDAEKLKQAVLKKAFSGELVPQNPDDEPASVLLDRIRAARASELPAKKGKRKKTEVDSQL